MRISISVGLLVACGGPSDDAPDGGGTPTDNEPPVASVWSHEEGAMVLEGWPTELGGTATDETPETLVTRWFVDGALVCEGPLDAYDNSTCLWTVPSATTASVRFEVEDEAGATDEVAFGLVIRPNAPPLILILEPSGTSYPSSQPVPLEGRAEDPEDDPGTTTVSWESDRDGPLTGVDTTLDASGYFAGSAMLSVGAHTLTATVTDRSNASTSAAVTIDVTP